MQKNIIVSLLVSGFLIAGMVFFLSNQSTISQSDYATVAANIEIKDGVQYVTVNALGGYTPRVSTIQPNIPTKLIVKTNGTYDCSAALTIRAVDFQKILQPTAEEFIDLGTLQSNETIQGVCSMGMYSFQIKTS